MDPDATLADLITAICGGDTEAAREHFENLSRWIDRGGFTPKDPR